MPIDNRFLDSFRLISKNQAEYQLLLALYYATHKKAFILELQCLKILTSIYQDVVSFIDENYKSYRVDLFSIDSNGSMSCREITFHGRAGIKEEEYFNDAIKVSSENHSYVLVCINQSVVLFHDGEFDRYFENTFADRQKLLESEAQKFGLDEIEYAFEMFHLDRKYKGCNYVIGGRICNSVNEQQLRNCLIKFLKNKTKLNVFWEFCTSSENDEESVDISLVDKDNAVSIIEVKYFVKRGFFQDTEKSAYSFSRFLDGYRQLDTYCTHINQEEYNLYSAYLYMFFAHSETKQSIENRAKRYCDEFTSGNECSVFFRQHYKKTICDDMLDS